MPRKGSKPRKRKDGRWEYRFYVRGEDGVTLRRVSLFGRSAEEALKKGRELQMKHERGLVPAKDPAPGPAHPGVGIPPGPPSLGCKATALTYEGGRSFEPCTGPRFKPS